MTFWRDQQPAFDKKSRVILIDLPGHGKSDKPQVAYTQDLFARAVAAVLKDAGVQRAVLVGHSMGTPVIREFYRKHPEKTAALVIVDGALRPFGDAKAMEPFIAPLRGPNYRQAASEFVDQMMSTVSPELKAQIKGTMLSTPQHVAVSAMEGMIDPAIWKDDKITVPVLAVLAKSPFWPPDNEKFFRSVVPDLEYHMWEGVSHFLMNEKPDEFNKTLMAFLQKKGFLK
jgi:pimeloyl-ACP methyl ester carboxylesterase